MTPSISVVIGALGRSSLEDTLDSITAQVLRSGDEVIVVRDSFEDAGDRRQVRDRVERYGPQFRYAEVDAGYHFCGLPQTNHGFTMATGDVVLSMGDDDIYTDGAFAMLRSIMAPTPRRPVLFQFLAPWRQILWDRAVLQRDHISGQCIAAPRCFVEPYPEGVTNPSADYDWLIGVVDRSRVEPLWLGDVLVIARPDKRHGNPPTGVTRCVSCAEPRYVEDVSSAGYCARCDPTWGGE